MSVEPSTEIRQVDPLNGALNDVGGRVLGCVQAQRELATASTGESAEAGRLESLELALEASRAQVGETE